MTALTWPATKLFIKKAWIWSKHHWKIIAIVSWSAFIWFISRRSSSAALEVLEKARKSYEQEIEVLSRTHEEELRKQKEAISTYNQVIESIEEESKAKKENLTFEKRARIKELVDSYHEDPNSLNSALQEEFGFTYVK